MGLISPEFIPKTYLTQIWTDHDGWRLILNLWTLQMHLEWSRVPPATISIESDVKYQKGGQL